MGEAVKEWYILKTSVGDTSKQSFALSKGIMLSTFHKYAHNYSRKRRNIGVGGGKTSVVSASNVEFTVQHTIRANPSNEGLTAADAARALLQLQPELKPTQARNYNYRTFKVK